MSRIKEGWHSIPKPAKIVGMVVLGLVGAVFFGFIFGFFVKFLWNWLMPDLFGIKEITYWQAFGIVILARLLFGSFGGGHNSGSKSAHNKKKHLECEDEKDDLKDGWRHWKYYDEWWKQEGKKAFEGYVEKKNEEKENGDG